ncbi:unnamed protein product [Cladocopium goreaui]|uniref:Uncharacterized protein n=1 Tax=Cladocopium goreaui TaxID=2562237 RepID=A0A9P1CA10_9DINO|nr:unnamed protein product [Cladocopium goreaui]
MRNQVLHAELADVRQQLRRLQKQTANAKRKKQGRVLRHGQGWRCSPSSPPCLVVLEYSGGIADVAADFVQGRGCWKKRTFVAAASGICSGERRQLVSDIESAYDTAPLSQIARLCGNPVQAGLVSGAQMLKILRWLMERSLTAWVEEQNAVHGVAPSRAQLVEQALCAIPALAPQFYQQKLRSLLVTTPRSQRRWLATFRLRWGLRIGKLKLCSHLSVQEKQSKEFKAAFKEMWRRRKAASAAGSVTTMQWLEVVVAAIEVVLPANDWEAAFAAVGAVAEQTCLGERLCDALGWKLCPQVPEGRLEVVTLRSARGGHLEVALGSGWRCGAVAILDRCAALLHQEMETLKRRRVELKRQSKQAAKDQKLLAAKRQLPKACPLMTSSCFCNVRNKVVLMCWKFRRMLSSKCQVMLLPSGLLLVAEVVEAPSGMRLSVSVAKVSELRSEKVPDSLGGRVSTVAIPST